MRVLLVVHGYPPVDAAGVELSTAFLARGLRSLGHRVSVFCREAAPGRDELAYRREEQDGITVHRVVNNFRLHASLRDYYENAFFDDRFDAILAEERPNVVHFHHTVGLSGSLLARAAACGARVLLTLHDYFFLCHRVQLLTGEMTLCSGPDGGRKCGACVGGATAVLARSPRLRATLRRLHVALPASAERWLRSRRMAPSAEDPFVIRFRRIEQLLRLADLVLFPSAFVRDIFVSSYPFLGTGVVEPLGIALEAPARLVRLAPPPLRLLFLGSLFPFKGVHVLLDALRGLDPTRVSLAIHGFPGVGADGYVAALECQARGLPVTFGGPYVQDDLEQLLAAAHVLVVPSICYETFSLVIREARRYGLAVVASRLGALPEAVRNGVDGWLVSPGDAGALAAALQTFLDDPCLAEQMGRRGEPPIGADAYACAISRHYERVGSAAA
jgi:glycosyltransferase involved in cell wall biosynthesis